MHTELRKRADGEAMRYRENRAYMQGVEDGLDAHTSISEKYHDCARWVWTVERVREWLRLYEPAIEDFFARYYALDGGTPRHARKRGENMVRVSVELHIGVSTLYKWREHVLDQLVLAATQAGALEPF